MDDSRWVCDEIQVTREMLSAGAIEIDGTVEYEQLETAFRAMVAASPERIEVHPKDHRKQHTSSEQPR